MFLGDQTGVHFAFPSSTYYLYTCIEGSLVYAAMRSIMWSSAIVEWVFCHVLCFNGELALSLEAKISFYALICRLMTVMNSPCNLILIVRMANIYRLMLIGVSAISTHFIGISLGL